jgi:hypothetical protein
VQKVVSLLVRFVSTPVNENCAELPHRVDAVDKANERGVRLTFWCFEDCFCPWLLTAAPRRGSCAD